MSLIPLKQQATVKRSGGLDVWGKPSNQTSTTYLCRIDESTQFVQSRVSPNPLAEQVISKAQILFEGIVDVKFDDWIEWTNELGIINSWKPIDISVLRDISGKPLFTKVVV